MSRKEILGLIIEIEAYRSLEGVPFDFGDGLIDNDLSYGTEEAYWEMELQELYEMLGSGWINHEAEYHDDIPLKFPVNHRLNRYARKLEGQRRLKKIHDQRNSYFHNFTHTYDERGFYTRFYLSGVRGYIKFCSDKAVRNRKDFCLRGAGYRRVFDYAYTLF